MSTDAKNQEEIILDEVPSRISRIGLGYNEDDFILLINCNDPTDESKAKDMFAATFPPSYIQKLIKSLFEIGKQYQKEFGKDIGFGDIEEE